VRSPQLTTGATRITLFTLIVSFIALAATGCSSTTRASATARVERGAVSTEVSASGAPCRGDVAEHGVCQSGPADAAGCEGGRHSSPWSGAGAAGPVLVSAVAGPAAGAAGQPAGDPGPDRERHHGGGRQQDAGPGEEDPGREPGPARRGPGPGPQHGGTGPSSSWTSRNASSRRSGGSNMQNCDQEDVSDDPMAADPADTSSTASGSAGSGTSGTNPLGALTGGLANGMGFAQCPNARSAFPDRQKCICDGQDDL